MNNFTPDILTLDLIDENADLIDSSIGEFVVTIVNAIAKGSGQSDQSYISTLIAVLEDVLEVGDDKIVEAIIDEILKAKYFKWDGLDDYNKGSCSYQATLVRLRRLYINVRNFKDQLGVTIPDKLKIIEKLDYDCYGVDYCIKYKVYPFNSLFDVYLSDVLKYLPLEDSYIALVKDAKNYRFEAHQAFPECCWMYNKSSDSYFIGGQAEQEYELSGVIYVPLNKISFDSTDDAKVHTVLPGDIVRKYNLPTA